jgi:hypothetical protein
MGCIRSIFLFCLAPFKYDASIAGVDDRFCIRWNYMRKKLLFIFVGIFGVALAASASRSPLEKFIEDKEFCAYMAALPENDSGEFLKRYQAAIHNAVSFIRKNNQNTTESQALFSVKAKCDEALKSMLHYK